MAIYITTDDPQNLIGKINEAIENHDIVTWTVDRDGDYTINREQWKYKAWLRPQTKGNRLKLGIVESRRFELTTEIYGVFHGRFISTLLAHFCVEIKDIQVTSRLIEGVDIWE